jgi:hypothetical protein
MDGSVNPSDIAKELLSETEPGEKEGAGSTPPESPTGEEGSTAEGQQSSAGDVKTGTDADEGSTQTGTEKPPAGPGKSPEGDKTVPYTRFQEVIDDRNTEREARMRLETRVDNLTNLLTQVATSDRPATKKETKEVTKSLDQIIEELDLDPQEARNLEAVVTTILTQKGVVEGTKVAELESTVRKLQEQNQQRATEDFIRADRAEKTDALKKYDGVITADELEGLLTKLQNSSNQRDKDEYDHSSYESIIRNHFHEKIVQREVDKALENRSKNPPAPAVQTGTGGKGSRPKKPEPKDDLIEPGRGGVAEMLTQQILSDLSRPGE